MRQETEIIDGLKRTLGNSVIESKVPRERRVFVRIKQQALKDAVRYLNNDWNVTFISTITGRDLDSDIELLYHLVYDGSISISIGVRTPKADPKVPTITDILPAAVLYEKEIHEMLGVMIEGHPDLSHLVLPEGWPKGVYPLRKEYELDDLKELTKDARK